MRLIDADEFLQKVRRMKKINAECPIIENDSEVNNYETGQQETFDLIIRHLSEQPTAYDVDAVVKQLEKNADKNRDFYKANLNDNAQGQMLAYLYAIEIVKGGGVDNA